MGANSQEQLTIRLRCIDLPGNELKDRSNVRLGIQKGKDVIEDVVVVGEVVAEEIVFTCFLRAERDSVTGKPNFLGAYAHGTPKERFVYLCWGERKEGTWDGFGRIKVQLKEIEWDAVEKSISTRNPIEATIKMTDKKGQPIYASVKKDNIRWKM